jgi:hypothetical protein
MGPHAADAFDRALAMADALEDSELARKLGVRK